MIVSGGNSPCVFRVIVRLPVIVFAERGNGHQGASARSQQDVTVRSAVSLLGGDVGNLHRLSGDRHDPLDTFSLAAGVRRATATTSSAAPAAE